MNVPYVPILGAVHPNEISPQLLDELMQSSSANVLLPYDKSRRWQTEPFEQIVADGFTQHNGSFTIDTIHSGEPRRYVYGSLVPGPVDRTVLHMSTEHRPLRTNEHATTVFIDDYSRHTPAEQHPDIRPAYELDPSQLEQLQHLDDAAGRGFAMLRQAGNITSQTEPVLVYVQHGAVVGAIGPLTVMADSRGVDKLLPCYFAVSERARRHSIGSALWNAARRWAITRNVSYKILQAEQGSAAEHFYRAHGLLSLGYVYRREPQ